MSMSMSPLIAAGADPELRFLSPAARLQRLASADPALLPVLEPALPQAPMICMIFPVKEDEPSETPQREEDEPASPAGPDPTPDTRH